MSVIIKSLDLPSNCGKCCFSQWSYYHQTACCKLNDYEPVADDFSRDYIQKRADFCPIEPWPEPKTGKWSEKEVLHKSEAETVIEEWQSCKCSVCGRYDTRPYLYYFDEPHFCSWCGADMRGEQHD